MKKILSVSGFGWSGSGAVIDLLKEYSEISYETRIEFDLLYCDYGIRDLDYYINEKKSRFSSEIAIRNFEELVDNQIKYRNYEELFEGNYANLSKAYLAKLIDFEFEGWNFQDLYNSSFDYMKKRLYNRSVDKLSRLLISDKNKCKLISNRYQTQIKHHIKISYDRSDFIEITKDYIRSLFDLLDKLPKQYFLIDQLLPADVPEQYFRYLDDPKCIIVRRDPRDTYLLAKCALQNIAVPLPTEDVRDFVSFYKKIVESSLIKNNERVLNIQYEDLIFNYDETVSRIETFLDIHNHDKAFSLFDPNISINNTKLYERYPSLLNDIKYIEKECPDSIFPFEKYSICRTTNEIF